MKKGLCMILSFIFVIGICFSVPVTASAAEVQISAPQNVSAVSTAQGIQISWNAVEEATSYLVFKLVGNAYINIAQVNADELTFIDSDVKKSETYCYAVAAMDDAGNVSAYSEIAVKYNVVTYLETPKAKAINTANGISLNWAKIENAEFYIVYRRQYNKTTKKYSGWKIINNACEATSYVDTSVKLGTGYSYAVRAVNGTVKSGYKATKGLYYNVVPTVKIANASNGIKVTWTKAANATGYTVYSSTYNTKTKKWSAWSNRGTTKAATSSWVDKKVKQGTFYRYTVRAVSGNIKTGYKATSGLKFLAQPTVKIENNKNGIKVSWNKISYSTNYAIYRASYANGAWSGWQNVAKLKNNVNVWTDPSVISGTIYRYTVRAVSGSSKSSYKSSSDLMYLTQPDVTVSSSTDGVRVNWSESNGARNYAVYRSEYVDGSWTSWFRISTTIATSLTDGEAIKGVKYRYTVRALNGGYKSSFKSSSAINGCVTNGGNTGNTGDITTVPIETTLPTNEVIQIYNTSINRAKYHGQNVVKVKDGAVNYKGIFEAGSMTNILSSIVSSFMCANESEIEIVNEAISSDLLPPENSYCNLTTKGVKSVKCEQKNGKYIITIVARDVKNPNLGDDGVGSLVNVVTEDAIKDAMASTSVIKSIDSVNTSYENVTVVATIDKETGGLEYLRIDAPCILEIKAQIAVGGAIDGRVGVQTITEYSIGGTSNGNTGGNTSNSKIDREALAMFQKAAGEINSRGVAGYTKKSWQTIESMDVGGNEAMRSIIEGFMTKEEEAEEKVSAKGSDDAKNRMPVSNCTEETIESVTRTTKGNNYVITIVMKDQVNPSPSDPDGLNVMSKDILYMEDVHNTVKNDATVSKLVKSLNKAEINYKKYTIVAEMTKDGKFVSITHSCSASFVVEANLAFNMTLSGDGVIRFDTKYWDFKY